jgi:hypothetical protein
MKRRSGFLFATAEDRRVHSILFAGRRNGDASVAFRPRPQRSGSRNRTRSRRWVSRTKTRTTTKANEWPAKPLSNPIALLPRPSAVTARRSRRRRRLRSTTCFPPYGKKPLVTNPRPPYTCRTWDKTLFIRRNPNESFGFTMTRHEEGEQQWRSRKLNRR